MKLCYKILHLDSATDRQALYEQACQTLSSFEQLDSPNFSLPSMADAANFVTINAPLLNFDPNGFNDPATYWPMGWKRGELAVWIAYYCAWKAFLETDNDYLLLGEDDVSFKEFFVPLLEQYISFLPKGWDVFSAFCPTGQVFKYRDYKHSFDKGPLCKAYQDHHLLCYVLSRNGAEELVKRAESQLLCDPVDWFIFYQADTLGVYTVKPREEQGILSMNLATTINHTQREPIQALLPAEGMPRISHFNRWHEANKNEK
jgi:hypothetical protein